MTIAREPEIVILYEDQNYLGLAKPAGLVVHDDAKTSGQTLSSWVLDKYPQIKGVGEPMVIKNSANDEDGETVIDRPGIVHRIDRETSGVIVVAKNQKAFMNLKKQFQNRQVRKIYNAFVYGKFRALSGVINRPIGRSRSDFRQWSATRGARGEMREAVTNYKVIKQNDNFAYLEIAPKTGRTHQIRVHMKSVSHPIVCDKLYASMKECALGFKRMALHARVIRFTNLDGKMIEIEAPLPKDFLEALEQMNEIS